MYFNVNVKIVMKVQNIHKNACNKLKGYFCSGGEYEYKLGADAKSS